MRGLSLIAVLAVLSTGTASGQLVAHPGAFPAAAGEASSVTFELTSSLGHPVAGEKMSGSGFELAGGILAVASTTAAPSVVHEVPGPSAEGEPVQISARVDGSVETVRLHYRRGGESAFRELPMSAGELGFAVTLPDTIVGSRGVSYYLTVVDDLGRQFRTPALGSFTLRVRLGGEGLVRETAQPAGTSQSAYRLVSIPIEPDDDQPSSVIGDDFGAYDPLDWRFFGLNFNQQYVEYPDLASVVPGEGYWLITRDEGRVLDTGSGTTLPTNEPFEILLHPRWNLIGTPFAFAIPLSQLRLTSGQPFAVRSVTEGWNDPIRQPVQRIEPFQGYALFNDLQRVDTLLVYPHPIGSGKRSMQVETVGQVIASKQEGDAPVEWSLHVVATSRDATDADNVLGVRRAAADGYDALDLPEPPAYGDFLRVHLARPEGASQADAFSTDFRSGLDEGQVWNLSVEAPRAEPIRLDFEGTEAVPSENEVLLVDEMLGVAVDLRAEPSYQLVGSPERARAIRIVVGDATFVSEFRPEPTELPRRAEITDVFPNPFESAASVRYVLPEEAAVSIRVYNALGAEVARLRDVGRLTAGAHLAVWDGRGTDGAPAASGVYFVRLRAGSATHVARVVLIR